MVDSEKMLPFIDEAKVPFKWVGPVLLKGDIGNIFSDKMPGNLDWKEYLKIRGINARMLNPKVEILQEAGFVFRLSRKI